MITCIKSILDDIGITQDEATVLYEDNQGALLVEKSDQRTKRTRHMDTKYFVIQHWMDTEPLVLSVSEQMTMNQMS